MFIMTKFKTILSIRTLGSGLLAARSQNGRSKSPTEATE